MADTKLAKVGITLKERWMPDISFEALDFTLWRTQDGGDGRGYIAKQANIGVRPDSDDSVWLPATEAGSSIYDLAVKYGYEGTEAQFVEEYNAAVAAANAAAASASAVEAQVAAAEASRVGAENSRVQAEAERQSAEQTRVNNEAERANNETARSNNEAGRVAAETDRAAAENGRQTAESTRQSNETARENAEQERTADFEGLKTDMQTAIQQADAATAAADEINRTVQQNEASRQQAESGRAAAETQRQTAETQRGTNESTRQTQETARQTAETSRQTAETTRGTNENARVAADNLRQQTFEVQSAQMTTAIGLAETATTAANAATEAANAAAEAASSIETRLMNGTLVPVKAGNLESWSERDALSVEDTHADGVRTTAGDTSIVTDAGARVVSIVARTDFFASALRATGFNLLHGAVAVGAGYYILVPALEFGSYGTAAKPNGILFTDSAGNNLQPTVRFKALSAGVPTSVNDGSACTYVDSNNHRFFTTPGAGYLIISGITLASTCAHVAWSRRYDEFIAPDAASDAGSSIALSSIIHAIHSFDRMLVVGSVADRIEFGDSAATWTRNVDRTVPSWTNTDNGDGTYTHTATIATMRPDGAVDCPGVNLSVEGTTISYTDSSAVASSDYVKFELATPVTGTVSVSPTLAVEDWGLEVLDGIVGSAYVTMRYAQSYPDSLAALAAGVNAAKMQALVEAIAALRAEVDSLRKGIDRGGRFEADSVSSRSVPLYNGFPIILSAPGVPAANLVPYEWDRETMGEWDGIPSFIGQTYINTAATGAAQVAYHAKGNAAVADWK